MERVDGIKFSNVILKILKEIISVEINLLLGIRFEK
jgi:hypothetical protein